MLPLLGDALGSIEYVVTIGIGLPAFGQTIGIDTGKHVSCYLESSYTLGRYASHTLALTGSKAIKGFQFIYSHTDAFNPRLNGLVKIGSGVQSFVSHKAATYGSQFSYCLPSTPSPSGSSP
uniref:Xylanase inhibitor N-terminal domain-containing protein n=1 Tax=Aegilops tauschii TaxID=37682 RepID=M8BU52_AEGTA